jgi:hypothetical protein
VRAEFVTIIDSPPAEISRYDSIGSNRQVNLYPGGVLPSSVHVGPVWQPGDNIEINLLGGTIGSEEEPYGTLSTSSRWVRTTNVTVNLTSGKVWGGVAGTAGSLITMSGASMDGSLRVTDGSLAVVTGGWIGGGLTAQNGSMVHMSGGVVGSNYWYSYDGTGASSGSVFLMSGGVIGSYFFVDNSFASLTGGRIKGELVVSSNGQVEIAGGSHGPINAYRGGNATLIGGEFQLDGVAIDGLSVNAQNVGFPSGSLLTGILSDGSPVTLANDIGYLHDYFADDRISLRLAPVPASEPRAFDAPGDTIPSGLRTGQSLTLRPGAVAPANFTALPGSNISIAGGSLDRGFEATGATVTLSAGSIGEQATIYRGTTLQVLGGDIGSNFEAAPGSRLEMLGGTLGAVFVAHSGSEVIYSGGKIASSFQVKPGSSFNITGGEFKINGAPLATLANSGAEQQVDLPEFGVLSGTLSDGTPFAFSSGGGWFAPGTLTLQATDVPAAGPALIRLPSDPVPQGLRSGQTLLLADGGEVGNQFTADWGSIVRMSGGRIGHRFQAVGSFVNVTGGEIESINALLGSVININGGSVNHHVTANRGAIVNLSAGEIMGTMYAYDGGRVNISGGTLGGYVYVTNQSSLSISGGVVTHDISVYDSSSLTLMGGETFGRISAGGGSQVDISGGRLGDGLFVGEGGRATLRGFDFRIDGEPIFGDSSDWFATATVDLPARGVLSGVFADGTPFAFTSSDGDWFAPGTLQVSTSLFPRLPRDIRFPLLPMSPPRGLRPGEKLTLAAGEQVGANFTAGWGSELTIAGGEIGENFEAIGAQVNLLRGSIGGNMDALFGTEFNVLGGAIDHGLEAHRGSVVNISGGTVQEIAVRSGSTVNITGGTLGALVDGEFYFGRIALEGGSNLHLTGVDFQRGGNPIEGLEPGSSVVLRWDDRPYVDMRLDGTLADGSPFSVNISSFPVGSPAEWQYGDGPTVTLTATVPGDFDGNLVVDAADYTVWRHNLGGKYDADDYLIWRNAYGWTAHSGALSPPVPEPPTALTLIGLVASIMMARSRKIGRTLLPEYLPILASRGCSCQPVRSL